MPSLPIESTDYDNYEFIRQCKKADFIILFMCKLSGRYRVYIPHNVNLFLENALHYALCIWFKMIWIGSKLNRFATESVKADRVAVHQVIQTTCINYLSY